MEYIAQLVVLVRQFKRYKKEYPFYKSPFHEVLIYVSAIDAQIVDSDLEWNNRLNTF